MEGLWWLIAIVLFLVFGKNLNLSSFNTNTGNTNYVPDGSFVQPNAVPTPDGIGAVSIQNQVSPPENQPAPWKSVCTTYSVAGTGPGGGVPIMGTAIGVSSPSGGYGVPASSKLILSSVAQN